MEEASRDYFILILITSLGTLQIAASLGGLRGLLLLRKPLASSIVGAALVVAGFTWYFASAPRNLGDTEGGRDANTQALLFALGSLAAVVVTLLSSSFINAQMKGNSRSPDQGLEALKETSYFTALRDSLTYWWKRWQKQMKRFSSG